MVDKRNLTPERKQEIAEKAAAARWGKKAARQPIREINLEQFCDKLAKSHQLPAEYYQNSVIHDNLTMLEIASARAFYVIQLGKEVGLQPAQAINCISVIDGKALINGDAQLALVLNSGKAEYVTEYTEGGEMYVDGKINMDYTAVCETKRVGSELVHFSKFSVRDAHAAELWGKSGPWQTHKARMMKYKARAFCLRDKYPDVLKGLVHSKEEMQDESFQRGQDIAPDQAAKKLSGILKNRMLHNTTPPQKEIN